MLTLYKIYTGYFFKQDLYLDFLFLLKIERFYANIQKYSDFQEFTNEYLSIFSCPKIYE